MKNIIKSLCLLVVMLSANVANAAQAWMGPYTIKEFASYFVPCGSGCTSAYRLSVVVNEPVIASCAVSQNEKKFTYWSTTANAWGSQWLSELMYAHAQNLPVMLWITTSSCSSTLGYMLHGIKVLSK